MAWSGILRIDQVFCLVDGALQMCPGPGRAFWASKLRTQLAVLSGKHQGSPRPRGLHEAAIRRALYETGRWRQGLVLPFQAARLWRTFAWMWLEERAASAARAVVYTDGSLTLVKRERAATMGFAVVFCFEARVGPADEVVISGATRDGPFASTTAVLMAILVVAVLLPPDQVAMVRSDSRAGIAIVRQLQDKSC
ncbi:hypothetical protein H4R19_003725 [Coemansia spiralis]|nr:hypothetical protein H4R19_003725 [Coemansia spiralis]